MKLSFIRFIILVWLLGSAQVVSAAPGVLPNNLRRGLWPESGSGNQKVRKMEMRGIGAEPAAASLQAAGAAKPAPLTKQELLQLVAAHLPNQRIAELLRNLGIDFQPDDDYLSSLRRAGANDQLITLVREASGTTGALTVQTVPNAQVFVDGNPRGQADAQGMLEIREKVGAHMLKVSRAGKQDFQQRVTVAEGAPTLVVAPLAELGGSVRVKALPGAAVWLDGFNRGTIDSSGELLLTGVSSGAHRLRVAAPGKVHDLRTIIVAGGEETPVFVRLADGLRENPQDGLKYVWIAPANFLMGCSPGDNDCADPEKPAHLVTLQRAYWIGQTEVTVAAYKLFVKAGKVKMPAAPKFDRGWKNDGYPMANVNWDEAGQYCVWAGGRLPTEAEWEYAARGGSPQARYGVLDQIAWSKENAKDQTRPVGGKQANGYGLFDALGNVWEWVNDWYDPNYYQTGPAQNPPGPATGQERVLRGGSWIVDPKLLRVSDRYSIKPEARSEYFGFRCVWEPKAP